MRRLVLIGGTGASQLVPADAASQPVVATPYGPVPGGARTWQIGDIQVIYLHRHGPDGAVPPHRVNYRANIWAVRELEPAAVIGINAVGGITPAAWPARLVLPHQLIDYTWGREQTFFDGVREPLRHVEFDPPFDETLRMTLFGVSAQAGLDVMVEATYGATQGPRLETAAEIDRLAADGCDIVGMTAMPEAALARELQLHYAICAVVVNRAAGRLGAGASIHGDLDRYLARGMAAARLLIETFVRSGTLPR
jgi:purine nucleoside phosphorylase